MADGPGGSSAAGMSPVKERAWKDKDAKESRLGKEDKKLKKEEFKEHKRSLSRDHSHKRSQSRDERKLAQEVLELNGESPTNLDMLHMSADNAGHQRLGPLEKLQQKFGNVLKGTHTVTNFRGEYTGKVDKDTGRFHGKGTLVTAGGDRYIGEWKDGELDGFGQYYGKDEIYEGNWKNGKIDGVGRFKWANGDEYEGTWRDSKAEGRGVYVWKNGDRYDGEWRENRKWGRGKKTFATGDEYNGEWKVDRPHGTGVYTWNGNGRYEGEWVEGKKHGRGWRQWTATRDEYSGDWKSDEISGHGTMTYGTGDVYEGLWRDGKRNGVGLLTRRNGDRYKGDWEDDRRHGLGRETFGNGDKYEGNYRCDKPEGFGIYVSSRGDRYEGEWRSGKRHGRGVLLTTGGDRYEGEWMAGERHGYGLLTSAVTDSSGEVGPLEVEFRDDQNFVRKQLPEEKQKARESAAEANKTAEEARRAAEASRSVGEEKIASSIAIEWSELELDKQPLGEGSYGVVFKGKFRGLTVAVKILKLNQSKAINVKLEEEFLKEVKMLAELRHPNIILFMGAATKPQFCFITEFMPRGNLFEYLANRAVMIDEAMRLKMVKDITLGMVYLHQRKPPIIHKDLKSLNILVDEQIRLKICDFGLSQVKAAFGDAKNNVIGTPQWCAPELLRNEAYDEKVDVYSFGVVLWEMVTRSGPYPNMTPDQVRQEVLTNHLRPIIPSSCPVGLRRLMEFCWSEKPEARPSFAAIIEYLSQYQAQGVALADAAQQQAAYVAQPPPQQRVPAPAPQPVYLLPSPPAPTFPATFFPAPPQQAPVAVSAASQPPTPFRPAQPAPQPIIMQAPTYALAPPQHAQAAPAYGASAPVTDAFTQQQSAFPPAHFNANYMAAPSQPFQIQPLLPPTRQSSSPQPASILQYTGDPFAAPAPPPTYAYVPPAYPAQFAAFPPQAPQQPTHAQGYAPLKHP